MEESGLGRPEVLEVLSQREVRTLLDTSARAYRLLHVRSRC